MTTTTKLLLAAVSVLFLVACDDSGEPAETSPAAEVGGPTGTEAQDKLPTAASGEPSLADYAAEARSGITPENVEQQAAALEQELKAELGALEEE